MREIVVTFTQPNRPLSINEANRMHWADKRRRLSPWRQLLAGAWHISGQQITGPVVIEVELTFARRARRDPHNYTGTVVKALVDALVQECRALPDDTPEYVSVAEPALRIDADERCTVRIRPR